ncbi:uncharacterized protein LOC131062450 isoform X2 [Cryptomeria japonica]|uniref:uncharacterized protein LOC131062450 isoform X2 n=1 Tax=Cryptomeria japonica TaxID=3369 RepID=UPI0025AD8989|nr:uncharacterized protein LOC131062450 isoform X2 [Cryptomeria japonica]
MVADSGSASGAAAAVASSSSAAPKIILAKPSAPRMESGGIKILEAPDKERDRESETNPRSRLPHGSLNLLSDSWDFHPDRLFNLVTDNTDFTVIGVLGPPGVGKSTILNELYGFDRNTSGVLPPFAVQSEENRAMARHCSVGIELRMSVERFILLDTQPVLSASVLTEMMRPDGSSAISVLGGDSLSAELAHELMGIQLGVFLASVCHVILLVTEGLHDISLWRLMLTVDMLKQGIPDPSLLSSSSTGAGSYSQGSSAASDKEERDSLQDDSTEFLADPVFIHTKRNGAVQYFPSRLQYDSQSDVLSEAFSRPPKDENGPEGHAMFNSSHVRYHEMSANRSGSDGVSFFVLPLKVSDDSVKVHNESFESMLRQLRDQVLSMPRRSFARPISERDWLRNAARIWDMVKRSPVIADYSKTLQSSGLYRR